MTVKGGFPERSSTRRRVERVDEGLPKIPHHPEGQPLPLEQALALVERVRASAESHAALALDAVALRFPRVSSVLPFAVPALPPTIAERIQDYRAQCVADRVLYRQALAGAAEPRSWEVHWYARRRYSLQRATPCAVEDLEAHFVRLREAIGPPWDKDHKLALAAAIVAAAREKEA